MNKGFGVTVTRPRNGGGQDRSALVVVATDEFDAELIATRLAGASGETEIFRELTADEVKEYGLDLSAHGTAKALSVPDL